MGTTSTAEPDTLRPEDRSQPRQPRHVLFLIDQLAAFDGGAEGVLLRLARLLPAHRYRASIATFNIWYYRHVLKQFPCPVHVFPMDRIFSVAAAGAARQLRHLIRSEHVDIVHTFFETSDLWGGVVAKLSGAPVLVSSRRDMGIQRSPRHDLGYRLLRPMFNQVQTVSDAVRDFVIERDGLNPDKVLTVHNGIDLERVAAASVSPELRRRFDLDGASHLIAAVGWIRRVKGADVLVRAAARICREFPRAVFLVMGNVADEAFYRELQSMISESGLSENFRFPGSSDRVLDLLKMCDVFCHLSRSDGLSNALLEAMACGVPCVATRVGGNPEVIEDGNEGFLVPSEQHDLAADRVITLLRDPARARRMGLAGRRTIGTKLSAVAMVNQVVASYDTLLASPSHG